MASSNYTLVIPTDDQNHHSIILSETAIAFMILLTVATGLRIWSRCLQDSRWNWADILMPCSLVFNIAVCAQLLFTVHLGIGIKGGTGSIADTVSFTKISLLGVPVCTLFAVSLPKLAILDLYLHVFTQKTSRYVSYICASAITLSLILNVPIVVGQCRPIAKVWDSTIKGHCLNIRAQFTWVSLIQIITDVVMIILPIPMIVRIQQTRRVKLGILISFLVGNIGLATSVVRFVVFSRWKFYIPANDPTYTALTAAIWTIVEPGTYHIAACLLTYRPLLRWLFGNGLKWMAVSRIFTPSVQNPRPGASSNTTCRAEVQTTMRSPDHQRNTELDQKSENSLYEIELVSDHTNKNECTASTLMRSDPELGHMK